MRPLSQNTPLVKTLEDHLTSHNLLPNMRLFNKVRLDQTSVIANHGVRQLLRVIDSGGSYEVRFYKVESGFRHKENANIYIVDLYVCICEKDKNASLAAQVVRTQVMFEYPQQDILILSAKVVGEISPDMHELYAHEPFQATWQHYSPI